MAKLILNDVITGFASTTATNINNGLIETALENTLSRDGTSPNQMQADLDMNGNRILNVLAQSGDGFIWEGPWVTATVYALNNLVSNSGNTYICTVAHTSGTFGTDLSAGKWELLAAQGAAGAGTGDMLKSENLSGLASNPTALANIGAAPLAGATFTGLVNLSAGANIASAATVDLTAATGNSPRITGTTATSAFTMNTGQQMWLVADGAWPLTYNPTTNKINGGLSYTCSAGDIIHVFKDNSGIVQTTILGKQRSSIALKSNGIAAGATEYMDTGASLATEAAAAFPISFACVVKNLYVKCQTAPGAGETVAYTLFKNGVGQTLTATISDTNTTASDTTNTVTFAAGDLMSLRIVNSASSAATTAHHAGMEVLI